MVRFTFYVKIKDENVDRNDDRIRYTFHNKCYICEDDTSTGGEIEHRIPKAADKTNKLIERSSNLFWACSYCNGKKSYNFYDALSKCHYENVHCGIIDCTKCDPNEYISIMTSHDLTFEINIVEKKFAPCTKNTVSLLREVYCPDGKMDTTKLCVLKEHIITHLEPLNTLLGKLFNDYIANPKKPESEINKRKKEIIDCVSPEKPFFAIKLSRIEESYYESHDNGFCEIIKDILKELSSHPVMNDCCDCKDSCCNK